MGDIKLALAPPARARLCGHFIAKDGGFAFRFSPHDNVWLEDNPILLPLLNEEVVIIGRRFRSPLIEVVAIAPVGCLAETATIGDAKIAARGGASLSGTKPVGKVGPKWMDL